MGLWDSISSTGASALPSIDYSNIATTGINSGADAFLQGATPSLAGIANDSLISNQISNIGNNSGLWGNISDGFGKVSDFALGDQGKNLFDIGSQGYKLWNQNDMMKYQKGLMNKQEARASDAYNRDKLADERRRNLQF